MRCILLLCVANLISSVCCLSVHFGTTSSETAVRLSNDITKRLATETYFLSNTDSLQDFSTGDSALPFSTEMLHLPMNSTNIVTSANGSSTEVVSTTVSVNSMTVISSTKTVSTTEKSELNQIAVESETTNTFAPTTTLINPTTVRSSTVSASKIGKYDLNASATEPNTTVISSIPVNCTTARSSTENDTATVDYELNNTAVEPETTVLGNSTNVRSTAINASTTVKYELKDNTVGLETTVASETSTESSMTNTKSLTTGVDSTISSKINISSTVSSTPNVVITELQNPEHNTIEPETDEPKVPKCGQRFTRRPRIVGGSRSLAGEFPWTVSVRVLTNHFCGGVIINKDWILTAGHCVKRFAARYWRIRLGGHDVNIEQYRPQWDIHVSKVVLHPRFGSPARYSYDMALLKLKRSIRYVDFAAPVCLPANLEETYEGWNVTVVGWGRTNESIEAVAPVLQKVVIPVVNNRICAEWYKEVHFGYIRVRDFQICAGVREGGKDACKGDSGGPLVVEDEQGRYTLVGIVSAGVGCGRSELPGIYSRVSHFVPWILKVTGGYTLWPLDYED